MDKQIETIQINEVADNGQTDKVLTPNTQVIVSKDWLHIPDWFSNIDIDRNNEESNRIHELETIKLPVIEDCSWNSETNQIDQTYDEEWLNIKPNGSGEANINSQISWDSIAEWESYHKKTIPIKWRQIIESELELNEQT